MVDKTKKSNFFFASYGCCIPIETYAYIVTVLFVFTIVVILCCLLATAVVRWLYKRRMRKRLYDMKEKIVMEQKMKQECEAKLNYLAQKNHMSKMPNILPPEPVKPSSGMNEVKKEGNPEEPKVKSPPKDTPKNINCDPAKDYVAAKARTPRPVQMQRQQKIFDPKGQELTPMATSESDALHRTISSNNVQVGPTDPNRRPLSSEIMPKSAEKADGPKNPSTETAKTPPHKGSAESGMMPPTTGAYTSTAPLGSTNNLTTGTTGTTGTTNGSKGSNETAQTKTTSGSREMTTSKPTSGSREVTTTAGTTTATNTKPTSGSRENPVGKRKSEGFARHVAIPMEAEKKLPKKFPKGSHSDEARNEGGGGSSEWKWFNNPMIPRSLIPSTRSWLIDTTGSNVANTKSEDFSTSKSNSLFRTSSSVYQTATTLDDDKYPHGAFVFDK